MTYKIKINNIIELKNIEDFKSSLFKKGDYINKKNGIEIKHSKFNKRANIIAKKNIYLNNCDFTNVLSIEPETNNQYFDIELSLCKINDLFYAETGYHSVNSICGADKVVITDSCFNHLNIAGASEIHIRFFEIADNFYPLGIYKQDIFITGTTNLKKIFFDNMGGYGKLGYIHFRGVYGIDRENNSYIIDNVDIKVLVIEDCTFEHTLNISNLQIDKLIIKNSDLTGVKFNGIEIGKILITNSNLNGSIFNGIEFKSYKLLESIDGYHMGKINLTKNQLKDNYRQLKHVMDKNGNYTEANKFYEKEMEYYKKTISYNYIGLFQALRDLSSANFQGEEAKQIGEILIISFGERINELGNNWLRPLQLILLLALTATLLDGLSNLTFISSLNQFLMFRYHDLSSIYTDIVYMRFFQ